MAAAGAAWGEETPEPISPRCRVTLAPGREVERLPGETLGERAEALAGLVAGDVAGSAPGRWRRS